MATPASPTPAVSASPAAPSLAANKKVWQRGKNWFWVIVVLAVIVGAGIGIKNCGKSGGKTGTGATENTPVSGGTTPANNPTIPTNQPPAAGTQLPARDLVVSAPGLESQIGTLSLSVLSLAQQGKAAGTAARTPSGAVANETPEQRLERFKQYLREHPQ